MQTKKNRQKRKNIVGKLYATWCGHCKTLEPEWKKMKRTVKKMMKGGVEFVEIESENMDNGLAKLNNKFRTNVKLQGGYPTLFKIDMDRKKVEYYNGNREANEMTKWSTKRTGGKTQKRK